MKHTVKLFTALSALLLGVMIAAPSCKKDEAVPAYQNTWVLENEEMAMCYKFESNGSLLYGICMDESSLKFLQAAAALTDKIDQTGKDFIMNLKVGEFACFKGTYTASPDSNDDEGILTCSVLKESMTIKYKMLSKSTIQFSLVSDDAEESDVVTGTAKKITTKIIPDSLKEIFSL